jgi:hypothetical protein
MPSPILRCGSDSLTVQPVFPAQSGMSFYSSGLTRSEYMTSERMFPDTAIDWSLENLKIAARNTAWTFWNNTLRGGEFDFTLIDHKSRMLFDVIWPSWRERAKKLRGGVGDIQLSFESSGGWTPELFALYPSTTNTLVNHTLGGNDLAVVNGIMTDYATNSVILRKTGYGLRLPAGGASATNGATGTVSWRSSKLYPSVSLFCQSFLPEIAGTDPATLDLVKISIDANRYFAISVGDSSTSAAYTLTCRIGNNSGSTYVTKAAGTYPDIDIATWYDFAITYDAINGKVFVYYCPSARTGYARFLDGKTDLEDGVLSTLSTPGIFPNRQTWTTCDLLKENNAAAVPGGSSGAYVQNVFIMDDHITPLQFDELRRWCWLWNPKTSGTWPK